MNQGTQGYRLTKKAEDRKSSDTVPLNCLATVSSLATSHTVYGQCLSVFQGLTESSSI
jgi:hypothetical protein